MDDRSIDAVPLVHYFWALGRFFSLFFGYRNEDLFSDVELKAETPLEPFFLPTTKSLVEAQKLHQAAHWPHWGLIFTSDTTWSFHCPKGPEVALYSVQSAGLKSLMRGSFSVVFFFKFPYMWCIFCIGLLFCFLWAILSGMWHLTLLCCRQEDFYRSHFFRVDLGELWASADPALECRMESGQGQSSKHSPVWSQRSTLQDVFHRLGGTVGVAGGIFVLGLASWLDRSFGLFGLFSGCYWADPSGRSRRVCATRVSAWVVARCFAGTIQILAIQGRPAIRAADCQFVEDLTSSINITCVTRSIKLPFANLKAKGHLFSVSGCRHVYLLTRDASPQRETKRWVRDSAF